MLINSAFTNEFRMFRGLRKGDPLSPFLFILVTEVLHLMLVEAEELGVIESIKDVIHGQSISHLQFAGDTILFLRADEVVVRNSKYILRCFKIFLGLSINFRKSCIVGFGTEEEFLFRMVVVCKCKIGELSFNFLGIPLGADLRKISSWDGIVERVKRKLSGWKSRSLSWAGKIVLINAVLSSLSIYLMSIFQAPIAVINKIDKIRRNLLWRSVGGRRKMAKVK